MTLYEPGEREPTEKEKQVLAGCQHIVAEYQQANKTKDAFWVAVEAFKNSSCPWMMGNVTVNGKEYDQDGKVKDIAIRGKVTARYKIHMISRKTSGSNKKRRK